MQHKSNIPKFSYGVIPEVARRLGIAHKAAMMRIRTGNIEAIKIAITVEEEKRREKEKVQRAIQKLTQ